VAAPAQQLNDLSLDHYSQREVFVGASAEVAGQMWSEVNPNDIVNSWAAQVPELTAVVSGAQLGAARSADPYVSAALGAQDVTEEAVSAVDPAGFAGVSAEGGSLMSLFTHPAFITLSSISDGIDLSRAMGMGRSNLDMIVRTEVADAGRLADQVALTSHRAATGYTRLAVGNSCARCLILAGKEYEWNAGFLRHPRCDCVHVPSGRRKARKAKSPQQIYDRMTASQRTRAGFTKADQRAIAEGADLNQVVNAQRGMYVPGTGRRRVRRPDGTTLEGTTRLGQAGARLKGQPRLTTNEIYRIAGDNRDEALALLYRNGYLVDPPRVLPTVEELFADVHARFEALGLPPVPPITRRPSLPGPGGLLGPAGEPVTVRPALMRAKTTTQLENAWRAEIRGLTGRHVLIDIPPGTSLATGREYAEGVLRGLERFPDARLNEIRFVFNLSEKEFAEAGGGAIHFNARWANTANRPALLHNLSADVDGWRLGPAGWNTRGAGNPTAVAIHEFGHILDMDNLGERIHAEVLLRVETLSYQADLLTDEFIQREISAYASKDTHEMIAEAFTDVMLRGEQASLASRRIVEVLEREYRAGGFTALGGPVARFPARGAASGLNSMTVPQLRDLARQHGVTIPPLSAKSDIVRILEAAGVRPVAAASDLANLPSLAGGRLATRRAKADLLARIEADPGTAIGLSEDLDALVSQGLVRKEAGRLTGETVAGRAQQTVTRYFLTDQAKAEMAALRSGVQAAVPLSRMTVPQLRTLARERGVTIPAGAKKADIVRLLDEGVPTAKPRAGLLAKLETSLTADEQARVARLVGRDPQIFATVQDRLGSISTSGNLSAADAAWLQRIYERERAFVERAVQDASIRREIGRAAKKAGLTPTEYRARVATELKALFDGKPIVVRRGENGLQDILASGRFKTSFETGRRAPGLSVSHERRELGETVMGVPVGIPVAERPVYGYVAINDVEPALAAGRRIPGIRELEGQEDVLSSYGQIQIVLKPEVRARTTATVGDSLDEIGFLRPTPVDAPTAESLGFRDLKQITEPDWTRRGYVEAQIHGGIRAEDIAGVVFSQAPDQATIAALARQQIPWRVLKKGDSPLRLADFGVTPSRTVAPDLAKLPVAQLRTMAADQGVTFLPAKATKAQLVEALRMSPAQRAAAEAKALRAAAAERTALIESRTGTAKLLAEVDELISGKATKAAIRERLDAAVAVDPDVVKALRAALASGEPTALRTALTRAGTKAKVKPISRAGAKVKFDPATMESTAKIPAGAQVVVVRRGSTLTLPDGTVLQVEKARVTAIVPKPTTPKTWSPAAYEARRREVDDIINAGGALRVRSVGGGAQGHTTIEVDLDGRMVVRKVYPNNSEGRLLVTQEELASRVFDALGVRAPAVLRFDRRTAAIEYIDGTLGDDIVSYGATVPRAILDSDDGRLIGLADYLTYGGDRNTGNWIRLPDGRIAAIDFGGNFGDFADPFFDPKVPYGLWGDFSGYLRGADTLTGDPVLAAVVDISKADLAVIRRRLVRLRPDFAAQGRLDWYNAMIRQLRELEKRAVGTRNMLAS